MNNVYTIPVDDDDFDSKLKKVMKKINSRNEVIVEQSKAGKNFVITTKKNESTQESKKLLLD